MHALMWHCTGIAGINFRFDIRYPLLFLFTHKLYYFYTVFFRPRARVYINNKVVQNAYSTRPSFELEGKHIFWIIQPLPFAKLDTDSCPEYVPRLRRSGHGGHRLDGLWSGRHLSSGRRSKGGSPKVDRRGVEALAPERMYYFADERSSYLLCIVR